MPLPDLSSLCVELNVTPQRVQITFPGGASLDPELPFAGIPDPLQVAKQLMGQANAALAPLQPLFNILDVALALFETVSAIPAAIASLDPSKIADALPGLAEKVTKLAPLVPQLSVPLMIVGILDTLIGFLGGLSTQLRALVDQQVRIQAAENRAVELGNAQLQVVADCAKHHVATQLASLSESAAPVNRLIAVVNVFAQLVGLGPLPELADLGTDAAAALQPIDDTVRTLRQIRTAIPV